MRSIRKYTLKLKPRQTVSMPRSAKLLSVHAQQNVPRLWALIEDDMEPRDRTIFICGTGEDFPNDDMERQFIGTVLLYDGALVLHVFEEVRNA